MKTFAIDTAPPPRDSNPGERPRRSRRWRIVFFVAVVAVSALALRFGRKAAAYVRSTDVFVPLPSDPRVRFEPGAESNGGRRGAAGRDPNGGGAAAHAVLETTDRVRMRFALDLWIVRRRC